MRKRLKKISLWQQPHLQISLIIKQGLALLWSWCWMMIFTCSTLEIQEHWRRFLNSHLIQWSYKRRIMQVQPKWTYFNWKLFQMSDKCHWITNPLIQWNSIESWKRGVTFTKLKQWWRTVCQRPRLSRLDKKSHLLKNPMRRKTRSLVRTGFSQEGYRFAELLATARRNYHTWEEQEGWSFAILKLCMRKMASTDLIIFWLDLTESLIGWRTSKLIKWSGILRPWRGFRKMIKAFWQSTKSLDWLLMRSYIQLQGITH